MMFKVLRPGIATDGTSFKDPATGEVLTVEYSMPEELELEPGTIFSATIPQGLRINTDWLVIESGPHKEVERKEFSSVGPAPKVRRTDPGF